MLSAQQTAAKEEAHRRFDYPTRIAAEQRGHLRGRDKLPRYRHGVAGIGIAGDILRIYVLEDQTGDLETPTEIAGLRTERVLTTGFHDFVAPRRTRLSPAPCGVSIGHGETTTGTLGCLVDTPNGRCILSNNHILAVSNAASVGDGIFQPGAADRSNSDTPTLIATLTDFEPLRFGSAVNRMDAAIAALANIDSAIPDIMTNRSALQTARRLLHWPIRSQAWPNHWPHVRLGRRHQLRRHRPLRRWRRVLREPDCHRWRRWTVLGAWRFGIPHPRQPRCSPRWLAVRWRRFSNARQSDTVGPQSFWCYGRHDMTDIRQAKRSLGRELRTIDGFVGVGIGRDGIQLYASADTAPVVKVLRDKWGNRYEGFTVSVVLSDGFEAQSQAS